MEVVLPGDLLGPADARAPAGEGTFVEAEKVYSAVHGRVQKDDSGSVSVISFGSAASVLPEVGSVVLAQIGRVTASTAHAQIVVCNGRALPEPLSGVIRREHVRESDIDNVIMQDTFRPSDVVRATVAAMGDARTYVLSTAGAAMGVVSARSEEDNPMRPVSWQEMEDVETGKREKRKVARVS